LKSKKPFRNWRIIRLTPKTFGSSLKGVGSVKLWGYDGVHPEEAGDGRNRIVSSGAGIEATMAGGALRLQ
jgi:hypothetical protein